MIKEQLEQFLVFLKQDKTRKINFILFLIILCLLPVKNSYTDLVLAEGEGVVRNVDLKLEEISSYPVNITGELAPGLTAYSALVVDRDSKAIIYARNPDQELFPASVTKMITALVAWDAYSLDQVLEIGKVRNVGRVMELEEGEKISFRNLLYGLLVQSGNDAAYALGDNYPGGLDAFVKAMNVKAEELNLFDTHFINPAGLDAYGHLSSAHDLALLGTELMKNDFLREIVNTRSIEVGDVDGKITHKLSNVNQLLGKVEGLKGIKTGWTGYAGECLVAYTERNGHGIITVVLSSDNRFGETKKLVEWVFNNFEWQMIDKIGEKFNF